MTAHDRHIRWFYAYMFLSRLGFQRGIFLIFLAERGLSSPQIGWLEAALFVCSVLAEVPTGLIGDRFGRRLSVGLGLCLLLVNGLGLAFSDSLGLQGYLLLFLLEGVGIAFLSGADSALLYDLLQAAGRADEFVKVAARARALTGVAMASAIAAGGVLQDVSWTAVYLAYATALGLALVVVVRLRTGPSRPDHGEAEEQAAAGPNADVTTVFFAYFRSHADGRLLLRLALALGLLDAVLVPLFFYSPALLQAYGVATTKVALVNAVVELSAIPALFVLPWLCAAVPTRRLVPASFGVAVILLLAQLAPSLSVAAIAYVAVFSIPLVTGILSEGIVHRRVPPRIRASALSMMSFVASALVGVAYVAYGVMLEHLSPGLVFALGVLPSALALFVVRPALPRLEESVPCT